MSESILPQAVQDSYLSWCQRKDALPLRMTHAEELRMEEKFKHLIRTGFALGFALITGGTGLLFSATGAPFWMGVFVAFIPIVLAIFCFADEEIPWNLACKYVGKVQNKKRDKSYALDTELTKWWQSVRTVLENAGFDGMRITESRETGEWVTRAFLVGGAQNGKEIESLIINGVVHLLTIDGAVILPPYQTGESVYITDDRGHRRKVPRATAELLRD